MKMVVVIRIRGEINLGTDVAKTLHMLRLYKKHNCVILPGNPNYIGMINKVKDYVTWGELEEDTLKLLLEKRARIVGRQKLTNEYLKSKLNIDISQLAKELITSNKNLKDIPGIKPFFKLSPPVHGFERNGIKTPYSLGGSLGYRKEAINALLRRML